MSTIDSITLIAESLKQQVKMKTNNKRMYLY